MCAKNLEIDMKTNKSLLEAVLALFVVAMTSHYALAAEPTEAELMRGFQGKIELDTRDSKPDWTPFIPKKAPKGAPNILFILYDDTGQAAWSPYGGRLEMPTLDQLAADGLTYTQWHTTSLCAPTRSTLQTGRNHHLNSFGSITETASGYPGYNGRFPKQVTTIAEVLQASGHCKKGGTASTVSSAARPTSGIRTW
jgi:hypothetical protein